MRFLFSIFILFSSVTSFSQGVEVKKAEPCYTKGASGNKRYVDWQCGKTPGVIDCGQELTYDEEKNIVYRQATDLSNLSGANKPFTGRCEMCHQNGTIQRRVNFVDGREHGVDTTTYESGCPQVIRNFVQGVENGTWSYYYDSTNILAWEMNYSLGEKHGKQIFFAKNGDTTLWENYQTGRLHGVKRTYYPDSKIHKEITYSNGIFDGSFKVYNTQSVLIQDLTYKMGKKYGEAKYYYDDGVLLRVENWNLDVKEGAFKTFYYQGHIQTSENYKKGIKEGWFEEFYPDSKPKNRSLFKKGVLVEEHRYDEHGRETYSFGTPTGDQNEDDAAPTEKKK